VKRTLWSILTAAAAAVLPGFAGHSADLAAVAPVPEAAKPAPEAVQVRKAEVRHHDVREDDVDDDPSPIVLVVAIGPAREFAPVPAVIALPPAAPDVAPLARRALGRPRVRAPDDRA
jgi:hypothetical protein